MTRVRTHLTKTNTILRSFRSQIQAIGYGAVTLMAILAHNCNIPMNDSRLVHFMYAIYFRGTYSPDKPITWGRVFLNGNHFKMRCVQIPYRYNRRAITIQIMNNELNWMWFWRCCGSAVNHRHRFSGCCFAIFGIVIAFRDFLNIIPSKINIGTIIWGQQLHMFFVQRCTFKYSYTK